MKSGVKRKRFIILAISGVGLLACICGLIPIVDYCTQLPPPNTEIIVSVCKDPIIVDALPDGETLWVREIRFENHYFLNLRTGEKKPVPESAIQLYRESGIWKLIAPELIFLKGNPGPRGQPEIRPDSLLNLSDGKQYPLINIGRVQEVYLADGRVNSQVVEYFTQAEQVYVYQNWDLAVALAPDYAQHPERNVSLHKIHLDSEFNPFPHSENGIYVEEFLKAINVPYQVVDVKEIYGDIPSPLGNYVMRRDGIYATATNTLVLEQKSMGGFFLGWYYDESGIVVNPVGGYLISHSLIGSHFHIPVPILKVPLP